MHIIGILAMGSGVLNLRIINNQTLIIRRRFTSKFFNMSTLTFLFVIIFQLVAYCQSFEQNVSINTSLRFLENNPNYTEKQALKEHKNLEKRIKKYQFSLKTDLYMIFRYRDEKLIPWWQKIVRKSPQNDLLKIWFIDALAQMGNPKNLIYISPYIMSNCDIIRECAINGYGFLAPADSVPVLESLLLIETNDYVMETIKPSIGAIKSGGYRNKISYLPNLYPGELVKIRFFYNKNVLTSDEYRFQDTAKLLSDTCPKFEQLIFPTQQFYKKVKYAPNAGWFGNNHGPIYHVGYDGGNFFEGLPVHSISNGVVKQVQHDLSWGCLVAIESATPTNDTVTVVYGHLSRFLSVSVGDCVHTGQRIGQIGNSVSYENGGYWSHLHLGIIKQPFKRALIVGYDYDTLNFEDPMEFIGKYSK